MKAKLNKNLTNIRNFFVLLKNENPTQEEIYNYLLELKTFVFNHYDLNENDYDISIEFVSPKVLDYDEAKMCAYSHDDKKFTITLNKHKLVGKYNLLSYNKKDQQQTESVDDQHKNRIKSILTLTHSFLHELGHVMIYIISPEKMKEEDELSDAIFESLEQVISYLENNRKKRLIIKTLSKHINALAYMSEPEKDANRKAYIYFANILSILIPVEQDAEIEDFLCVLFANLNALRKLNYKLYRQYSKENREAIEKLHDLDFENELEKLSNSLH